LRQLQNSNHSLKGYNSKAQGNALGRISYDSQPEKGEIPHEQGLNFALTGLGRSIAYAPGRCLGLVIPSPSG
jgi:hypothetical protein